MLRAVSTRVGLYFGFLQLVFGLAWVEYVIYLPQLGTQAGIGRGVVSWILVLDQLIFALCDWAVGVAVDRVAKVVGRVGKLVAGATAVSAMAFLLLPFLAPMGAAVFILLVVIWAITSSALRAPPLALLGRYTPAGQQPWVGALFVIGAGIATALTPFLAGGIAAYDPRILFAASAISVLAVTFSIAWAENTLATAATPERPPPTAIRSATFLLFLAAVLLLQIGFQVHSSINAQPLFAKYAGSTQLPIWLSLFWIGFTLLTPLAALLIRRFDGLTCIIWAALVGAGSAWAATQVADVVSLGIAQFVCGGAWGCMLASAVATAFTLGRGGSEGTAVGAFFSVVAVATMARIALVAAHGDRIPAVAAALPWVPSVSWFAAVLILLRVARRRLRLATNHQPGAVSSYRSLRRTRIRP